VASEQERCDHGSCRFVWATVSAAEVAPLIREACAAIARLLRSGAEVTRRPTPEVWSPVEYACHVRDVLLNLRDRVVVALNEDNPAPKGMYGTPRVELGLYAGDSPQQVADEVLMAGDLFARTWQRIPPTLHRRTMVYGWPVVADRTIVWVAAQALHEAQHHLADISRAVADAADHR